MLDWDSTYAIALELRRLHSEADLETLGLERLREWTLQLPEFEGDPALCNDEILRAIHQEWYEAILHDTR